MPSTDTDWRLPIIVLGLVFVAYAFEVGGNVLFGVFVAAVLYLLAWLIGRLSAGNPLDDMSRQRRLATGAVVLIVLAYSVIISTAPLLGALVAATVSVVAWITSPVGPVARWLDGWA